MVHVPSALRALRKAWSFGIRCRSKRIEVVAANALRRQTVVTYATWRTSSTSVHRGIRASGTWPCLKAHALNVDSRFAEYSHQIRDAASVARSHVGDVVARRALLAPGVRSRWVIVVRDPLAMAASFLVHQRSFQPPAIAEIGKFAPASLYEQHGDELDAMVERAPLELLDRWFDLDVLPSLGWSPLDQDFNAERGFTLGQCDFGDTLTIRADADPSTKNEAISRFVGRAVDVRSRNGIDELGGGGLFAALVPRLHGSHRILERLSLLRSSSHFWTKSQLEGIRRKWSRRA